MFDQLIDKYRPAAQSVADQAVAYMERIIGRLDMIHCALLQEDDDEWFADRRQFSLVPPSLNADLEVTQVPQNESWELEVFSNVGTAGTLRLFGSGMMMGVAVGAANPTAGNAKIVLRPGTEIVIQSDNAGGRAFLQFRVHRRKLRMVETTGAGVKEIGIGGVPSPQAEIEEGDRHGQPNVTPMANVIGERHG